MNINIKLAGIPTGNIKSHIIFTCNVVNPSNETCWSVMELAMFIVMSNF